jgi:hypothetical protein
MTPLIAGAGFKAAASQGGLADARGRADRGLNSPTAGVAVNR